MLRLRRSSRRLRPDDDGLRRRGGAARSRGDRRAGAARVVLADPIAILGYLFSGGATPNCLDAADANDDGIGDLEGGAARVAARIEDHLSLIWDGLDSIEVLRPIFYRNKGAYLVGRLAAGSRHLPLVLALRNTRAGVAVDAVFDSVSVAEPARLPLVTVNV